MACDEHVMACDEHVMACDEHVMALPEGLSEQLVHELCSSLPACGIGHVLHSPDTLMPFCALSFCVHILFTKV